MMTTGCWAANIPARWFSLACFCLAFATAWAADNGAVARLGQGINAYSVHDYAAAAAHLRGLSGELPKLRDYAVYHLASAELQGGEVDAAVRDLAAYAAAPVPSSPLEGKIVLLYGRALLDRKAPDRTTGSTALEVLQTGYKSLPQPDGDFALARAYEAQGERLQAALTYEKVFYTWPNTDLAAQALTAIERLRGALGRDFPEPTPRQQLDRCRKWLDVRDYYKARQEYSALASSLPEPDRDAAKVGIGAAQYLAGDYSTSYRYLTTLKIRAAEADAERLYYIAESARRMEEDAEVMDAVRQLDKSHPDSPWRLKALLAAGSRFVEENQPEKYASLFKTASDEFPDDASTAAAHWKIAWDEYLADGPARATLLREQIERYPADSHTSTALYFLGRIGQRTDKPAEARAYYERLSAQYPHYFYGVQARERMKDPKLAAAKADPAVGEWLGGIEWPGHRDFSAVEANPATRLRIDRARLLMMAGLPDLADAELRFGAATGNEQPHLLALELARSMPTPFHAMRIMKSFSSDYLAIPFDAAPLRFWQTLFPLPYKDDVVRNAKSHNLDPFSVAALIRQETEFNPQAHSRANAYGLMQLIPSTGRALARQQGISIAGPRTLLDPAINIQLGTAYLRQQLDARDGDWVQTLASYNAGPGRVRQWRESITYREPAEFVESIPFNETREYVQAVLRNADVYRTLYGEGRLKGKEITDLYDVPPVNLSSLPLAARTPGGGVKTPVARLVAPGARAKSNSTEKRPEAAKKTLSAAKIAPASKKTVPAKTAAAKSGAAQTRKKTAAEKKRDPA